TAADTGGSGLASVAFQRRPSGGGSWTTIGTDSSNPYSTSFDTTGVGDGLYDFRSVATDRAGNDETSPTVVASRRIDNTPPITTRVDNTPPALTFSSPGTGAVVSATVTLTASASDASPASPPVTFAYKLHSDPPSAYTATGASWNTATLPGGDGLYDLRARATDDASNTTTVENTSIRVDNVPPSVAITAPAAAINGSLPSPTSLSATAGDPGGSGVQQVQFFECSNQ